MNSSYNFLLNCDFVNATLKECLARYESNLQTNVCVPNEVEYINCHIKKDPSEFNSSELESNAHNMVVDIKKEVPDISEDENDSDTDGK